MAMTSRAVMTLMPIGMTVSWFEKGRANRPRASVRSVPLGGPLIALRNGLEGRVPAQQPTQKAAAATGRRVTEIPRSHLQPDA
jgi:hypothetical protein